MMKNLQPILGIALLCLALSPLPVTAAKTSIAELTALAQKYEQKGKYEEALQIYHHILTIDPSQKQVFASIKRLNSPKNVPLPAIKSAISNAHFTSRSSRKLSFPKKRQSHPAGIPTKEYDERFKKAETLLSHNALNDARIILEELYQQNPNDINIHLRLGELYSRCGEFPKAKGHYEKALSMAPDNVNAQEGLAQTLFALKEYRQALVAFEQIDKKQWNERLEYHYKRAKVVYLSDIGEYPKAQVLAEELYQKYPDRIDTVRDMANIAEKTSTDPGDAIVYRKQAYRLSHSVDDLSPLLYSLINAERFTEFETYFNTLPNGSYTQQERDELQKIHLTYYRKLASSQLARQSFEPAEQTARNALIIAPSDPDLNECLGWSLLNQNKNAEALRVFEKILTENPDPKFFYAASLSAHKNNEPKKAHSYLFDALKTTDIDLLEKVAELYYAIGYPQESLDTLKNIDDLKVHSSKENPSAAKSSNEHLRQQILSKKQNSAGGGLFWETHSGTSGIDRFTKTVLPFDFTLIPSFQSMFHAGANFMYLQSGSLSRQERSQLGYGTDNGGNRNIESLSAIVPYVGYTYTTSDYSIEAKGSTTPLNNPIGHTLPTGYLQTKFAIASWQTSFKVLQDSINETMLSYVGQKDPDTGAIWGRIVRLGAEVSFNREQEWITSLALGYYPSIEGINTLSNSESKATLFFGKRINIPGSDEIIVGSLFIFDQYEHSTNHFTYGHGGYFSPTSYALASIYGDYTHFNGKDTYLKLKGDIGYSSFSESSEPYYPLSNNTISVYPSKSTNGFAFNLKGYAGYKLDAHLHLLGVFGYSAAPQYNAANAGVSLLYYFDDYARFYPQELQRIPYLWEKYQ